MSDEEIEYPDLALDAFNLSEADVQAFQAEQQQALQHTVVEQPVVEQPVMAPPVTPRRPLPSTSSNSAPAAGMRGLNLSSHRNIISSSGDIFEPPSRDPTPSARRMPPPRLPLPPSPTKGGFRRPTTRNTKDFYYISKADWDSRVRSNNKNDKDYLRQYHYAGLIMETDAGVDREPPCSKCQAVGVKCKAFGPGLKNPSNTDTCARCRIFKGGKCVSELDTSNTGAGEEQEWVSKADFNAMKAEMQRHIAIQANQIEEQQGTIEQQQGLIGELQEGMSALWGEIGELKRR